MLLTSDPVRKPWLSPRLALHLTTPEPRPWLRSPCGLIFLFFMVASLRQGL